MIMSSWIWHKLILDDLTARICPWNCCIMCVWVCGIILDVLIKEKKCQQAHQEVTSEKHCLYLNDIMCRFQQYQLSSARASVQTSIMFLRQPFLLLSLACFNGSPFSSFCTLWADAQWASWGCCGSSPDQLSLFHSHWWSYVIFYLKSQCTVVSSIWVLHNSWRNGPN